MCGRTALTTSPEDLREAFGLAETPQLVPHYNVPPSQPLAVVRVLRHDLTATASRPPAAAGTRTMDLLHWGLVPAWAEDRKIGHRLALARVETAATTPAFRDALRHRRCLVVVDGFYEWRRTASRTGHSQPFFVYRNDAGVKRLPFALAGLWERWVSSDGEVVESCAILTQPARPPVDAVHDRMPLFVERESWDRWLDPAITDRAAVESMLAREREQSPALLATPVSTRVNDPRHDDPACMQPEEPVQGTLF
jgi:putative SOS response-associated peptidase YedK